MSEKSGFFNAELGQDGQTYDRVYLAESFAQYFSKFIGNGVFVNPATQLQVIQNTIPDMTVRVKVGAGFINGYWYENDSELVLNVALASGTSNRVDMVVLRWDGTSRGITIAIRQGTDFGGVASPSALVRTDSIYELALAYIDVPKGATSIINAKITDKRNDNDVCGYVTGVVSQISATNLFAQFQSEFDTWFDTITGKLTSDVAGSLQSQIDGLQTSVDGKATKSVTKLVTAAAASWTGATAPFTQAINVAEVTADSKIFVSVGSGATTSQYASAVAAQLHCSAQGAGTITLKAFDTKPTNDIPISVIILG